MPSIHRVLERRLQLSSGFGKTTTTPSFAPLELRFRYQVIPHEHCFATLSAFRLLFAYVLHVFLPTLPPFCLRFACVLHAFCLHSACVSPCIVPAVRLLDLCTLGPA